MRRKSIQPAKPSSEPVVVDEAAEPEPLSKNIVIYKKSRGTKEPDIGDISLIEAGDAVDYHDADTQAIVTARVEKVNVQAGVLRTVTSKYGEYIMRYGKKLTFAEIIAVTRKRV